MRHLQIQDIRRLLIFDYKFLPNIDQAISEHLKEYLLKAVTIKYFHSNRFNHIESMNKLKGQ